MQTNLDILISKLKKIKTQKLIIAGDVMKLLPNTEYVMFLNREQMYSGQTNEGKFIKPDYKSLKYAKWKQQITPNSKRGQKTPNLYITGSFYGDVKFKGEKTEGKLFIMNNVDYSKYLVKKYDNIIGLNEESMSKLTEKVKPQILKGIKEWFTKV